MQQRRAVLEEKQAEKAEISKKNTFRKPERNFYPESLSNFLDHRQELLENSNIISTYRGTIKWLTEYFEPKERMNDAIESVTHMEIGAAVLFAKNTRNWKNTTYNNEVTSAMILFNWLANEEYMPKNPSKGRIKKLKTTIAQHKWYDRQTAKIVKKALIRAGAWPVYRACQFTYHICIQSKVELMKLKVGDIDRVLKRIPFSADLLKDGRSITGITLMVLKRYWMK